LPRRMLSIRNERMGVIKGIKSVHVCGLHLNISYALCKTYSYLGDKMQLWGLLCKLFFTWLQDGLHNSFQMRKWSI